MGLHHAECADTMLADLLTQKCTDFARQLTVNLQACRAS